MFRSKYKISGMDCPSEEQMIRMQLENTEGIKKLDFDIPNRSLEVFHSHKNLDQINALLDDLKMGSELESSESADETALEDAGQNQRKILWWVLAINFGFFIIEFTTGFISRSMGLVADSLDMLADSFVYGMSLMVVGSSVFRKKKVATLSGYFQIMLAILGFAEVIRRFMGAEIVPDYKTMIIVSAFALLGNSVCLYLLNKAKSKEAHMRASWIFTSNDVLVNLGVIVAAVLIIFTNSNLPDLIVGTLVFALVLRGAFRILKLGK
ncbi:MAG: cation diffusion facilitator family transporter [Bacteroidales bacterium]|nr:cation diffusion facilitator family transporter [Bacteroidales bacterium]